VRKEPNETVATVAVALSAGELVASVAANPRVQTES
jgi:hypothetical protein